MHQVILLLVVMKFLYLKRLEEPCTLRYTLVVSCSKGRDVPLEVGGEAFSGDYSRVRVNVSQDTTNNNRLRIVVNAQRAVRFPAGTTILVYGVSAVPRSEIVGVTEAELEAKVEELFYVDVTPRYATIADLSDNWVLTFSAVPDRFKPANLVEVNFQGVLAYRSAWNPNSEYILFGLLPNAITNITNNTGRNQATWEGQVTFFNGTENLGSKNFVVAIDRG